MSKHISIVTPVFNGRRFIENCVQSVRHAFAGLDYEHIVVDGVSTDGTLEWLREQTDLKVFSERDQGMYDALNKGIAAASGEWIGHLNSDEQYNLNGIREVLSRMRDPRTQAIFGPTVMLNGALDFLQLFNQVVTPRAVDTLWCMPVQTCSFFFKRSVWEREPFDIRYRLVADHAWFRAQMLRGLRLAKTREPIGIFVWHGANLSSPAGTEDANAGVNKRTFLLKVTKHWYRMKKTLLGGYLARPLSYEVWKDGQTRPVKIVRPVLKIRNFDKLNP